MADISTLIPNKDQFDTMNIFLAAIAEKSGGVDTNSWKGVRSLVRRNLHSQVFPVYDQLSTEKAQTITASKADSKGITGVTVDNVKFLEAMGEAHDGVFEITFDGAAWHKADGTVVSLDTYGITVTGTPAVDDHIIVTESAAVQTYDVADHDKMTPVSSDLQHTLVLLDSKVAAYGTIPFDSAELVYYTVDGLPAGAYKFTLYKGQYGGSTGSDGTYTFTLTTAVPAGGGLRFGDGVGGYSSTGYTPELVTSSKVTTYGAEGTDGSRPTVESNVAISAYTSGAATDLGTFVASSAADYVYEDTANNGYRNFTERQRYGSNNYKNSAARQWLNSAAPAPASGQPSGWWKAQTVFDMRPGGWNLPGYLYGFGKDFVDSICPVKVKWAIPYCDRPVGSSVTYEELEDKVWLASQNNIYGSTSLDVAEGEQFKFYEGSGNADKIKYQGSTARNWWLRSALPGFASSVRVVVSSGALGSGFAGVTFGLVPGLCIG